MKRALPFLISVVVAASLIACNRIVELTLDAQLLDTGSPGSDGSFPGEDGGSGLDVGPPADATSGLDVGPSLDGGGLDVGGSG